MMTTRPPPSVYPWVIAAYFPGELEGSHEQENKTWDNVHQRKDGIVSKNVIRFGKCFQLRVTLYCMRVKSADDNRKELYGATHHNSDAYQR